MQERHQYRIAQPRDFLITSAFSSDLTAVRRDPQLYKSERVQPSADDRPPPIFIDLAAARRDPQLYESERVQPSADDRPPPIFIDLAAARRNPQLYKSERVQPSADDRPPPIFIDLAAARRNKSSFSNNYERYLTNINVDRSNSLEMQEFIATDNRKSLEETTKNKKTTRPVSWPQSSRSSPSHRHYRSNDSSCCCCVYCSDSHHHNELASDQHGYNDKCCQCDKCCDKCCDGCVDVCVDACCDGDVFCCCLEICCKIGCLWCIE